MSQIQRLAVKWWRVVVAIALLATLVWLAGPTRLLATVRELSWPWALLTLTLAAGWLVLGGLNVWLLLRRLAPVPFRTFVSIYLVSWAMTNFVPGQLGDVAQMAFLRRHGVPVSKSSAAYLVDKFVSLVWMLMVATYGLGLYAVGATGWWLFLLPPAAVAGLVASRHLLLRMPAHRYPLLQRVQNLVIQLTGELRALARYPGLLLLNVTLTVLKWLVVALKYFCAFLSFGVAVPFVAAATIPIISSLVGYLPITVGGIGTTEMTAAGLFASIGVSTASVVGTYLFMRLGLLLVAAVLLLCFRDVRERAVEGTL